MRQAAANDVGDLGEDVADVERLGHRVQQAAQAVDALAPQRLAVDDGGVLEGQAEQVDDAVHAAPDATSANASSALDVSQTAPCTRVPWRTVQRIRERALGSSAVSIGVRRFADPVLA